MTPAIKQTGINKPKVGWHTLRRSYASLLLPAGRKPSREYGANAALNPEMTLATYAQP